MQILDNYAPQPPLAYQLRSVATTTATSTTAQPVTVRQSGKLVLVLSCTQNCYIRFGQSDVTAATSNDYRMVANKLYAFETSLASTHFRVRSQSADGVLTFYVPGSPDFSTPPAPSSVTTIAQWQSDFNLSASSWLDRKNSIALAQPTAGNQPTIGVDSTFFGGRTVVQCVAVGLKHFNTGVLGSNLWAIGTRPWFFLVARQRVVTGNGQRWWQGGKLGEHDLSLVTRDDTVNPVTPTFLVADGSAAPGGASTAIGTTAHIISHGIDSLGRSSRAVDGAAAETSGTGLAATANCNLLSLGAFINVDGTSPIAGFTPDISVALLWILSAAPTATEERAIVDWAQVYYKL